MVKVTESMILSKEDEFPFKKISDKIMKSHSFIEAINKNIEETRKDGKEHGFSICSNDEYLPGAFCSGNDCRIDVPTFIAENVCKKGKIVGHHHTHPEEGEPFFSAMDMAGFIEDITTDTRNINHDEYIECLSNIENRPRKTLCYVPKRKITHDDYIKVKRVELEDPYQIAKYSPGLYKLAIYTDDESN